MAQNLFRRLVAHLGWCCPYAFVRDARGQSGKIAAHLGISRVAYRAWKLKYKRRQISCEQCEKCRLTTPEDWYP